MKRRPASERCEMGDATYIVLDIETEPLPDDELLQSAYSPPDHPGTFDPKTVDIGRAKKKETIDAKIEEARKQHASMVANWDAYLESHKSDWLDGIKEDAALSPLTGRVLAVGIATEVDGKLSPRIITGNEQSILSATWQAIEQAIESDIPIIGHNLEGFDIPFLTRRSWRCGIDCPNRSLMFRGRYLTDSFIDTQTEFLKGTSDRHIKLDKIARFLGAGGKPAETHRIEWEGVERPLEGEHFWRYFRDTPENKQRAIGYLVNDLAMAARVAKRMQLV